MFSQYPIASQVVKFQPALHLLPNVSTYIKRDDLYSKCLSGCGTSSRKVEFLFPEIVEANASTVVIIDYFGSPLMLDLAAELRLLDIDVHCIMMTEYTDEHRLFMSSLQVCGATVYGAISHEQAEGIVDVLARRGNIIYVVRPGGISSTAYMGGFSLFDSLLVDCFDHQINEADVYVPVVSGVTVAGMLLAKRVYEIEGPSLELQRTATLNIIAVPVNHSVDDCSKLVFEQYSTFLSLATKSGKFQTLPHSSESVEFSIAESTLSNTTITDDAIKFAQHFYKETGVLLDPVLGIHQASALFKYAVEDKAAILVNPSRPQFPYYRYTDLIAASE